MFQVNFNGLIRKEFELGSSILTLQTDFRYIDEQSSTLNEDPTGLIDAETFVNASASMNYASGKVSKLEYAKFLAASLAYIVLKQRDSVGLSVFDSEVRAYLPPRSAMGIILQIDRLLRDIKPTPKTFIAKQLHDIALQMKRRSFVILISDLFSDVDDIQSGLDHLRWARDGVPVDF